MEFVYVVERVRLFDLAFPHGFIALRGSDEHNVRLYVERAREHGFFVERRHAERDSSLKQIIPYCVLTHGGEVFETRRLAESGEKRLHGLASIGIGGHINPGDEDDSGDPVPGAMQREINEEVDVPRPYRAVLAGAINDESNAVGSVHFGLVHAVELPERRATVRETGALEGRWTAIASLRERYEEDPAAYETWSGLIIQRLDDVLAALRE